MKKTAHKSLSEFNLPQQKSNISNLMSANIDNAKSIKAQKRMNLLLKSAEYLALFGVTLILSNAKIAGTISPFSFGFCFALSQLGYNPLFVGPTYIISQILQVASLQTLTASLCVFAVLLMLKGVSLASKKQIPPYLSPAFQLLALVGYIYYHIQSPAQILQTTIYVIIATMFTYICSTLLRAIKSRGVLATLTLDENICFALVIMSFSLGLHNLYIWKLSISTIATCFIMLCTNKTLGAKHTLYFAALSGFGIAFGNGSLASLSIFCAWAVALSAHGKTKIISLLGVCLMDFVLGAYFSAYPVYTYINQINLILPALAFILIPTKVFNMFAKKLTISSNANGVLLADLNRLILQKKLQKTSKLLENMGENYQKIAISQTKFAMPELLISNEVINSNCKKCENYSRCMRQHNLQQSITNLSKTGAEKAKVTLLDIPQDVALYCTKTTSLLSSINHAVANYNNSKQLYKAQDDGKMAVGEQLVGTSKILEQFAATLESTQQIDEKLTNSVYQELLSNDIVSKDLQVSNGNEISITLIVRASESDEKIAKVISKMIKMEFETKNSVSKYSGYKLLKLTPKPKYEVSVGVASSKKDAIAQSGDNYSVVNLDNNKLLISICDGMGSGTQASAISERVLELVENFYMAGFDSDLILKNVAHLISTSESETYATLDICIFDKSTGCADFLKSSAPPSAHKTKEITNLIKGEALPIGIVESRADSSMKILSHGDIVVLASDGVIDAFASDEEYAAYINNTQTINMSLFCENLLQEAKNRSMQDSSHADDMTVLSLRVI